MKYRRWSPPPRDDASRYAIGDPTYRVYGSWSEVPASKHAGLRRLAAAEAAAAYRVEGAAEAAAVLRRAWALDHDMSWRLLLAIDRDDERHVQRTHILVLREQWAEAWHTGHRHPIGSRLIQYGREPTRNGSPNEERIAHLVRLGQWREWRSRVVQWLITYRPTWSLSERRTMGAVAWHDPLIGTQVEMDLVDFEAHLAAMWPGTDCPTVHEAQEVLLRARAYTRRDVTEDVEVLQLLRDPLVQRPETPIRYISEWAEVMQAKVGGCESAQPKYGFRAIPIGPTTEAPASPIEKGQLAQSIAQAKLMKLREMKRR